jgi:hypothetical protein
VCYPPPSPPPPPPHPPALVRFIKRKNAAPLLGCLSPYKCTEYECLHFNRLPLAEDVRDFIFSSLDVRPSLVPTAAQQQAADDLVRNLDLTKPVGGDDDGNGGRVTGPMYQPEDVLNPVLQRFYELLKTRALAKGQPVHANPYPPLLPPPYSPPPPPTPSPSPSPPSPPPLPLPPLLRSTQLP